MREPTTLFQTTVGSHMWGMNHPGSDTDLFEAFLVNTSDLLRGDYDDSSTFYSDKENKIDLSRHEAGEIVDQLLTGNVNFLWGVLSPLVTPSMSSYHKEIHEDLKNIVLLNLSKNIYNSINALATANTKKYLDDPECPTPKKLKKAKIIARTCMFGIRVFEGQRGNLFEPMQLMDDFKVEDVKIYREALDATHETAVIPEKPEPTPFRDWLEMVRNDEL